ncbi:MAG: transglutaminase domain-containing protein [Gilvibacter sp.]
MRSLILILFFVFMLPLQAQQSDFKTIDFTRADQIATAHKGEELYNLPILVFGLTRNLNTEVEKFRSIYYWVCHNIKGEYNLMQENLRMRKKLQYEIEERINWEQNFKKLVLDKLRSDKETLCTGYAILIQQMAQLAGLECKIINGYGRLNRIKMDNIGLPNHSWNAIKLNGKWYLCDATWSSGLTDVSSYLFEFDYDDSYFLMEPIEFAKNHRPIEATWALITQPQTSELGGVPTKLD